MIKIVIEDPQTLPQSVLIATGKYLLELGGHGVTMVASPAEINQMAAKRDQLGMSHRPLEIPEHKHFLNPDKTPEECASINRFNLGEDYGNSPETHHSSAEHPFNGEDEPQPLANPFIGVDMAEPGTDKTVIPHDYNPFANQSEGKPVPAFVVPPAPIVNTPSVETDSTGLPWDGRIHSRTKSKMVNGQWKNTRGIDPELIKRVTAELRTAMAAPAPAYIPPPLASVPPAPMAVPQAPASVPPAPMSVPIAPAAAPIAPIAPATPASTEPLGFPAVMAKISQAVGSGKLTKAQVAQVVTKHGLPALTVLPTRPDLLPAISADIDALLLGC